MDEASLTAWILAEEEKGTAPSYLNTKFAGICIVIQCRTWKDPEGEKFIKKILKNWMKKHGTVQCDLNLLFFWKNQSSNTLLFCKRLHFWITWSVNFSLM